MFMPSLKFATEMSSLPPNKMMGVKVDGIDTLLANIDGKIYALSNLCTHARCGLSRGKLTDTMVECPCHGSRFDVLTGEAKNGPAYKSLTKYDVVIEGTRIMIRQ